MDKIKILLVDDDINWLKMLTAFLNKEEDLLVVGATSTKEEALNFLKTIDVDVVLLDINLTGAEYDGLGLLAEIQKIKKVKVIMLTGLEVQELIPRSFWAGAVNFFSKANFKGLPNAIRDTYYRQPPLEVLLQDYLRLKKEEQLKVLTRAEKEVFGYLEQGYTQAGIAELLNRAESTIKSQVKSILKKFDVPNSKAAVEKIKRGFPTSTDEP
jgi:NarL family two-component system response regulator LiaR